MKRNGNRKIHLLLKNNKDTLSKKNHFLSSQGTQYDVLKENMNVSEFYLYFF